MSAIQLTVPADCYNCLPLHVCASNLHPCTCAHLGGHSCAFFLVNVRVCVFTEVSISLSVCVCVCYTDSLLSLQVISWLRREIERRKRNIQWERNKDRQRHPCCNNRRARKDNKYVYVYRCMHVQVAVWCILSNIHLSLPLLPFFTTQVYWLFFKIVVG